MLDTQYTPVPLQIRKCPGCKHEKPLDAFYAHKTARRCKECLRKKQNAYHAEHKEERQDYNAARSAAYYVEHKEERQEYQRDYARKNAKANNKSRKARRHAHPELEHKRNRSTPELHRVRSVRRRARKHNLPDTFTIVQHAFMLKYFRFCCAACGKKQGESCRLHVDHWIPLASPVCPGTTALNIVPLCGGKNGCNNSKGVKEHQIWLVEHFGKRKSIDIMQRIELYFIEVAAQQSQ
jgi:hypothetical protein